MENDELLELHKKSIHNKEEFLKQGNGGCFFCFETVDYAQVDEWWDKGTTAVCPYCSIDSIIPGLTDKNILEKLFERWFTGKKSKYEKK